MTLPRVVIEVEGAAVEGAPADVAPAWTVVTRLDGHEGALVAGYGMGAVAVTRGDTDVLVPVLDQARMPSLPDPQSPATDLYTVLCAGDVAALKGLLKRIDTRQTQAGDVQAYGRWLFECLLAPAWPAIRDLDEVRAAHGVELALRLPADAPDLHSLVWEAMHDGPRPLAAHTTLTAAITRLVPVGRDGETKPLEPLAHLPKVLMAAGSALHDEVIRPGAMFMGLMRSLCAYGGGVSRFVQEVSLDTLQEKCAAFQPDIVHLVAHGEVVEDQCVLRLRPSNTDGGETDARTLATALSAGGRPPLVLTLAVCGSGVPGESSTLAADLVRLGVPIVSAIAGDISETACRLYTRKMVQAVHDGLSLAEAAARGRRAALLYLAKIDDGLDWAMPALFVAERVPPGFAIFDPVPSRALFDAATRLQLVYKNVFIERAGVFTPVERLFGADDGATPLRTVIYGSDGPINQLGGTRLLHEIGLRLLRAGHIPLLVEYSSASTPGKPKRLRAAVAEVVDRLVRFSKIFEVPVEQATVLETYPRSAMSEGPDIQDLRNLGDDDGQERVIVAKEEFGKLRTELNVDLAARRLSADLTAFAARMAEYGQPFGEHSRVVLLVDELSSWGNGATAFLDLADREGFGKRGVLVATGTYGQESALKTFRETHRQLSGYIFTELAELTAGEANVGYQWVLLNPWLPDKGTYARARRADARIFDDTLGLLPLKPATIETDVFYTVADAMAISGLMVRNDDEAAFCAAYPGQS